MVWTGEVSEAAGMGRMSVKQVSEEVGGRSGSGMMWSRGRSAGRELKASCRCVGVKTRSGWRSEHSRWPVLGAASCGGVGISWRAGPASRATQSSRAILKKRFLGHFNLAVEAASESFFGARAGRSTQPLSATTASRSPRESLSRSPG
jgi:hypothetical protein